MKRAGFMLLLASLVSFACSAPAIRTTVLVPARFHPATRLKEVAVLPFDGPGGKEFAAQIEGVLAGITIDDKQYFTLIERTRLENILKEQELSQTGMIDETTAARVGKLTGAKGIYTGVVTSRMRDTHYQQNRQECVRKQIKYDKKGNAYEGDCISWRNHAVPCIRRNATFSFTPKLIEVETGRIIYSHSLGEMTSASACQDSGIPLPSGFELMARAKESSMAAFTRDIAPFYATFNIKLMESKEGIASKEAARKLDQGMDYVKNNRLDRACELWGEGRILSPHSPALLYNLAICAEVRGDLENALDMYQEADRALNKPDDKITAGIGRVSRLIQKRKTLEEQLQ
jgi:tetratricopeptide (TPR) repeat protein